MVYECAICKESLGNLKALSNHYYDTHKILSRKHCPLCDKFFSRKSALIEHLSNHSASDRNVVQYACKICLPYETDSFPTENQLNHHYLSMHSAMFNKNRYTFRVKSSAFRRRSRILNINLEGKNISSIEECFEKLSTTVLRKLEMFKALRTMLHYTFHLIVFNLYVRYDEEGNVAEKSTLPTRSKDKSVIAASSTVLKNLIKSCEKEIIFANDQLILCGSGWSFQNCQDFQLVYTKSALAGGCHKQSYGKFLYTIRGRKYLSNIPTSTERSNDCFFLAIANGLLYSEESSTKHSNLDDKLLYYKKCRLYVDSFIDTTKIQTPVRIKQIALFERRNKHLYFGVNVFLYNARTSKVLAIYRSKQKVKKKINLLMLPSGIEGGVQLYHYVLITNLSKFIGLRTNKSHSEVCSNCLQTFENSKTQVFERHQELCLNFKTQNVDQVDYGTRNEFKNFGKQVDSDITGFIDFESSFDYDTSSENMDMHKCVECKTNDSLKHCTHGTYILARHVPTTFSMCFFDRCGVLLYSKTESSDTNLMERFYDSLAYAASYLLPMLQTQQIIKVTPLIEKALKTATVCYLCKLPFDNNVWSLKKCIDHSHYVSMKEIDPFSGEPIDIFRGIAHISCNSKRKTGKKIVCFAHNLLSYDINHILSCFNMQKENSMRVSAIARNTEKFRSVTIGPFQLVDSLSFLNTSLDKAVDVLARDKHAFTLLDQFPYLRKLDNAPFLKALLLRKGVYCYEYSESVAQLKASKTLPAIKYFYSRLKNSNIHTNDYIHACNVFNSFKMPDLLSYAEMYCMLDSFLLAECMMSFRKNIRDSFNLDAYAYISLPSLTLDAALKMTRDHWLTLKNEDEQRNYEIEICSNAEINMLVESNIRGGLSFVNTRYAKKTSNSVLAFLDATNLYGLSLSSYLPLHSFEMIKCRNKISGINFSELTATSKIGYFLLVDLMYPKKLHSAHGSFPMIAAPQVMSYDKLSKYSKDCLNALIGEKHASKHATVKLGSDFLPKNKMLVHYLNFNLYMKHGIVCKKIHSVIKFAQGPVLKLYMDTISKKRADAQNEFEKNTFKLMSCSLYGKFIQDTRNFMQTHFCRSYVRLQKLIADPRYITHQVINENLSVAFLRKHEYTVDRNNSIGFAILEIAKFHMVQTYYDFIMPSLGHNNIDMILSDTDSFLMKVSNYTADQLYTKLRPILDLSNFSLQNPLYSTVNKGKLGYFKSEIKDNEMIEVTALKSKVYAFKTLENENEKDTVELKTKCKGVNKQHVERNFTMNMYKRCLMNYVQLSTEFTAIRAKKKVLRTVLLKKVALTSFDNKRWILKCGLHSRPFSSRGTNNNCSICPKQSINEKRESIHMFADF